jgi:hypothetical protein
MKIADILRSVADALETAESESHIGTASPFTAANQATEQPCATCQQAPCGCDMAGDMEQPDELDIIRQLGGMASTVTVVGN